MIGSRNYQLGIRETIGDLSKRFNEDLRPLVCSPLSKSQNAMLWIASLADVRKLWRGREDSVLSQMDVLATVIFQQQLAVRRQQHSHRSGKQDQFGRDRSAEPI